MPDFISKRLKSGKKFTKRIQQASFQSYSIFESDQNKKLQKRKAEVHDTH